MDLELQGKRALVLASSRGLGLGVATQLAQEGAEVILTGRDASRLEDAAAYIAGIAGTAPQWIVSDLTSSDAASELAKAVQSDGDVDIVVNNTGGPPPGSVLGFAAEQWDSQFVPMVRNVITLARHLVPPMQSRGWGRVLTLASSGVIQPIANLGLSNTLRSALVGWSKTLAEEVASDGVTVNVLVPGRIETERTRELDAAAAKRTGRTTEQVSQASRATIPAGRYGRVEEFAAVAAFLVSGPASYVTGSVMRCDGGLIRSV
jgi:3-oxoacyl-[acyl-carrier protein] reductase